MRMALSAVLWLLASPVPAGELLEPTLRIAKGGYAAPQVALTFDACGGGTDLRILSVLVEHRIPATIFVTGTWIAANPEALAAMLIHPDLFQLENHGLAHIPPVLGEEKVYGITPAGTLDGVLAEVRGGADAISFASGLQTHWYRGATARYSPDAVALIASMGLGIAGYSLNGDFGAGAIAADASRQIAGAKDGDVILAHINQPAREAGEGVVEGILALKAKGFAFVRLDQVETVGADGLR